MFLETWCKTNAPLIGYFQCWILVIEDCVIISYDYLGFTLLCTTIDNEIMGKKN
jgi:hypothetical protein